jgi:uncharacterized protein YuzE
MKKIVWYDKEEDILGIQLGNEKTWKSVELPNGIVLDVSEKGKIIGLEIANAKNLFKGETRKVLEAAMQN